MELINGAPKEVHSDKDSDAEVQVKPDDSPIENATGFSDEDKATDSEPKDKKDKTKSLLNSAPGYSTLYKTCSNKEQ